ncbi:MAG: hypothetical protein GYB65_17315 [Chloroflexi bacterium]|nr:hypothetical protein [Chloroflexota bacterium]
MTGDFSRRTFDPGKHFSRVLLQQGRVLLDSDWNEQTSILLHFLRTLARDIIGPHGGPGDSFQIVSLSDDAGAATIADDNFAITAGNYYVDGILCVNEPPDDNTARVPYRNQPFYTAREGDKLPDYPFVIYLDVWERHVTAIEQPHIREIALNGPDTAIRAQVVWEVKTVHVTDNDLRHWDLANSNSWDSFVGAKIRSSGKLRAEAKQSEEPKDANCLIPAEARYRGPENQLYRVEIHDPGKPGKATFKWSRNNAAHIYGIRGPIVLNGGTLTLAIDNLGRDAEHMLAEGDWVEVVNRDYTLRGEPRPLLKVNRVFHNERRITLEGAPDALPDSTSGGMPMVVRWDQKRDTTNTGVVELPTGGAPIELEQGVFVQFQPNERYNTGDYWLIPARTLTRDVEWPWGDGVGFLPPHGPHHYYAPLALAKGANDIEHLRRSFKFLHELS